MFLTITSKPLNNSKVIPYQALLTHQSTMMSKNSSKFHIFLLRALTTCLLKIDGQKLLLKPNEVILIKKISSLTLQSLSKKSALQILLESYSASYPFDFVTMGGSPLIHDMMHNTNPTKSVYIVFRHLPAQIIRSYYNLLANLENQNAVADPTITFERTTLIGLLLAELIRNYQKTVSLTDSQFPDQNIHHASAETQAGIIFQYIVDHIQNISVKEAAHHFGYSHNYFSRLCKKVFKANFSEKVTEIRLELACRMLSLTRKSVTEISTEIGYADPTSFYKIFKTATGTTPSSFRNRFNAAHAFHK
ncbi:helix-turn-helix transcriptional regulator [Liquorilactobacillus satsumensis]|uniref:helix-turn-helix transcriptional regulator n=1 Tax=Liquorilactobacillus satsumensis TaxID=259059 RepID=UPI0021C4437C|nr:AraC family transcriptional regulator [Liquorilactobacillus satsumensis]MCP9328548.1 helix-turn-helix transcriptional regulator [Liquorilactobacillus satsumensis]